MSKVRLVVFLCFMAAFGAGVCAGVLWQRRAKPAQDGWLSELNLSPEQREKIKAIWTESMKVGDWQAQRDRREAAQKERDEALRALLTGEQKPRFEEIMSAYHKKADEIAQAGRKARDEAYERTKALLTENQRVLYDELRKKRFEGWGRTRTDSVRGQAESQAPGKSSPAAESEPAKAEGTPPPK
ncbi:MAG: hypothetical protein ABSE73_12665 [Planctomycetota bacterium]